MRPERFTVDPGITDTPAISPDGSTVAYLASEVTGVPPAQKIYLDRRDTGRPTHIPFDNNGMSR